MGINPSQKSQEEQSNLINCNDEQSMIQKNQNTEQDQIQMSSLSFKPGIDSTFSSNLHLTKQENQVSSFINPEHSEESKLNLSKITLSEEVKGGISYITGEDCEEEKIDDPFNASESFQQPRVYQQSIVDKIKNQWSDPTLPPYGSIVFMETGSGKTYIAIMMIKYHFGESEEIKKLTDSEKKAKDTQKLEQRQISSLDKSSKNKVIFIVPTNNLVDQQGTVIDTYTNQVVGKFHGGPKFKKYYEQTAWEKEFKNHDVFVFIAKKFYDLLFHGFIKMENIGMIIFDECHHTDQEHLYNLIMRDFYFYKFDPAAKNRPRILALTASPIKQRIDSFVGDIDDKLQNLCNNLYSKFVSISKEELALMRKDIDVSIRTYEGEFYTAVNWISDFEKEVIKPILGLIHLGRDKINYSVSDPYNMLFNEVQNHTFEAAVKDQDNQILKFMNCRKQIIELDCQYTRTQLDLSKIKDREQQMLLTLSIILLKNVNNLMIELGPAGIIEFIRDLQKDIIHRSGILKAKKNDLLQILNNYIDKMKTLYQRSHKVELLIKLMKNESKNPNVKAIIFVKDRSVAHYLKKILIQEFGDPDSNLGMEDEEEEVKESFEYSFDQTICNNQYNNKQITDGAKDYQGTKQGEPKKDLQYKQFFRIDYAMGYQGKNIVNKAYKSTDVSNVDYEKDIQSFLSGISSTIKMTNEKLKSVLQEFRSGNINILIATNVVEEGLDVSTCNLVICLNELMTVKAFIQMKGRARQVNSKFLFLCSQEEEQMVRHDIDMFRNVIQQMEKLAYSKNNDIKPDEGIERIKQESLADSLVVEETGAKLSFRDSKVFFESFCQAYAEVMSKQGSDNNETLDSSFSSNNMKEKIKPIFEIREVAKVQKKFYVCLLHVPKMLYPFLDPIIKPEHAFVKKKDSENHVALIAIKKLYAQELINKHLYPTCEFQKPKKSFTSVSSQSVSSSHHSKVQKSMISKEEEEELKRDQLDYKNKAKYNKSKAILDVEQGYKAIINDPLALEGQIIIQVFKNSQYNNNYPYKTSNDYLGVVLNRNFDNFKIQFSLQQEQRQRLKNQEHILNLLQNQVITENTYHAMNQENDCIEFEIDQQIAINVDLSQYKDHDRNIFIQKLRFFHTWSFYYMYSADYKFFQQLLKKKFTFSDILFKDVIKYLTKYFPDWIVQIFSQKTLDMKANWIGAPLSQVYPFIVPVKTNNNGQFEINNDLIENTIANVKCQLLNLANGASRYNTTNQLSLDWDLYLSQDKMIKRVWNCDSTGQRHVILVNQQSHQAWNEHLVIFQQKQKKFSPYLNQSVDLSHASQPQHNILQTQSYTVSSHYFAKCGIFLRKKENSFISKCRRERHYLDMSKQKECVEEQKKPKQRKIDEESTISSTFDIPQQLMTMSPLSYDQYQLLQASCSFLSILNEHFQVERFIEYIFEGLQCYVEEYCTFIQGSLANDVFASSQHGNMSVVKQLLSNNHKVMQALTAPTANRDYDYERLEFYGDSVISFLVILELFLTKTEQYKEGDLDFYRIKTVSNMNFNKINREHGIYKYMIIEPQKIFSEFTPPGFEGDYYQTKLKQKHLNEINNKLKYLKNQKYHFEQEKANGDEDCMADLYPLVCKFVKRKDLLNMLMHTQYQQTFYLISGLIHNQASKMQIVEELIRNGIGPRELKIMVTDCSIYKTQALKESMKLEKNKQMKMFKHKKNNKIFQNKQLADVIESVAGAVTEICGINTTQDYLQRISVLKFSQEDLQQAYQKLLIKEMNHDVQTYYTKKMYEVEQQINYTFKCKVWLIQALTHKSHNEQQLGANKSMIEDYEKLEFLGDSILNFLVSRYFFKTTENDEQRKMPKELHKMKAAVINNALLSLIVIENQLYEYVIYNEKAQQFKDQFTFYITYVQDLILKNGSTQVLYKGQMEESQRQNTMDLSSSQTFQAENQNQTSNMFKSQSIIQQDLRNSFSLSFDNTACSDSTFQPLDLDLLYEHNLKIFGDIFESIIGAVFLDSQNIEVTWGVLEALIMPYIKVYADLERVQDHSRTKLLELWNSKHYTKGLKCYHKSENKQNETVLKGYIGNIVAIEVTFDKDSKNKLRAFYKKYFQLIEEFLTQYESKLKNEEQEMDESHVLLKLTEFIKQQQFN